MEKKYKKILTIITLTSIIIPVLLLIGAIFGLKVFEGVLLTILLSFATIAVAGAFGINAINIYSKQKVLSIISMSLLAVCTIFGIIIYFSSFNTPEFFNNLTIVLAMATILFCIIVSMHIKLYKKYLTLQVITYICIILIDLFLTINIFFVNLFIDGLTQGFLVLCLVSFALLCATSVLGKKNNNADNISENNKYIKITIEEYNSLKNKIKELEKELSDKQ